MHGRGPVGNGARGRVGNGGHKCECPDVGGRRGEAATRGRRRRAILGSSILSCHCSAAQNEKRKNRGEADWPPAGRGRALDLQHLK